MAEEKKPTIVGGKPETKQGVTIMTNRGVTETDNENAGVKIVAKSEGQK